MAKPRVERRSGIWNLQGLFRNETGMDAAVRFTLDRVFVFLFRAFRAGRTRRARCAFALNYFGFLKMRRLGKVRLLRSRGNMLRDGVGFLFEDVAGLIDFQLRLKRSAAFLFLLKPTGCIAGGQL